MYSLKVDQDGIKRLLQGFRTKLQILGAETQNMIVENEDKILVKKITVSDGESKINNVYAACVLVEELIKGGQNPIVEISLVQDILSKQPVEIPEKLEVILEMNNDIFQQREVIGNPEFVEPKKIINKLSETKNEILNKFRQKRQAFSIQQEEKYQSKWEKEERRSSSEHIGNSFHINPSTNIKDYWNVFVKKPYPDSFDKKQRKIEQMENQEQMQEKTYPNELKRDPGKISLSKYPPNYHSERLETNQISQEMFNRKMVEDVEKKLKEIKEIKKRKEEKEKIYPISQIKNKKANQNVSGVTGKIIFSFQGEQKCFKNARIIYEKGMYFEITDDGINKIIIFVPFYAFEKFSEVLHLNNTINFYNVMIKVDSYSVSGEERMQKTLYFSKESFLTKIQEILKHFREENLALNFRDICEKKTIQNCILCLVVGENQFQDFISKQNRTIKMKKILAYDPQTNQTIQLKLWNERTSLIFFNSVYLMNNVDYTEYLGKKQLSTNKKFRYKAINSKILNNFMIPYYKNRRILLKDPPKEEVRTIKQILQNNEKEFVSILKCSIDEIFLHEPQLQTYLACEYCEEKFIDKNTKQCSIKKDGQCHIKENYEIKIVLKDQENVLYAEVHGKAAQKMIFDPLKEEEVSAQNFDKLGLQKKRRIRNSLLKKEISCKILTIHEIYGENIKSINLLYQIPM